MRTLLRAALAFQALILPAQNFTISTFAGWSGNSYILPYANGPYTVAVDSGGDLYCAASNNRIYRITPQLAVTVFAGNGSTGAASDGTTAVNSPINPSAIALDPSGNLYVADSAGSLLWKIGPDGILHHVPTAGLKSVGAIAVDGFGTLYVADMQQNAILELIAGASGFSLYAPVPNPISLAADAAGNVYVTEYGLNRISRISLFGSLVPVAGTGTQGHTGDGGPALQANIYPSYLATGNSGDLYFTEGPLYNVLRHVDVKGTITTIAGNPMSPPATYGDGGPAASASFQWPRGIAVAKSGNIYVADSSAPRVREIDTSGTIHTVFGMAGGAYWGDNSQATLAGLYGPNSIAADASGNVFVSDSGNGRVRRIDPAGVITTYAAVPSPNALALDATGNLYVSTYNSGIRKVTPTGAISTYWNTSGPIALDASGNLYVAANNSIQMVTPAGVAVSFAGTGAAGYTGDGGPAKNATFNGIESLAFDPAANLYIADSNNFVVRKIDTAGTVHTVAGDGSAVASLVYNPNFQWVPATGAGMHPIGVACDRAGNLFIADFVRAVYEVDPEGWLNLAAGNFQAGYIGDGGPGTRAELVSAVAVAADLAGDVYIADHEANAIRMLRPTGPSVLIGKVFNAGSFSAASSLAPGEIFLIAGSGLGPVQIASAQLSSTGYFPMTVAGTSVLLDGNPVPLLYTSQNQIAAIVPFETSSGNHSLAVTNNGQVSPTFAVIINTSFAGGLFTLNSVTSALAAINQDGSINSEGNPARAGSAVTLYATGLGQTNPPSVTGGIAGSGGSPPILPVNLTIGTQPASILYVGAAPGLVSSLTQINVLIPSGLSGSVQVFLTQAGLTESRGSLFVTSP